MPAASRWWCPLVALAILLTLRVHHASTAGGADRRRRWDCTLVGLRLGAARNSDRWADFVGAPEPRSSKPRSLGRRPSRSRGRGDLPGRVRGRDPHGALVRRKARPECQSVAGDPRPRRCKRRGGLHPGLLRRREWLAHGRQRLDGRPDAGRRSRLRRGGRRHPPVSHRAPPVPAESRARRRHRLGGSRARRSASLACARGCRSCRGRDRRRHDCVCRDLRRARRDSRSPLGSR